MSIIREKCSDIVLCKKVNGAMKTSSVDSNSRSPNLSPMESKHRRFAMLRRFFKPWQWKRRFSSGLDGKGKKEYVPLRTAYSQAGRLWHPTKPVFARRRSYVKLKSVDF
ncbi:hypothetical protein TNCV_1635201 [Trichonephila clavipes]|nr:hypothetical protein TNCV_1635201 [Trichonephila clavipes]